MRLRAMLLATVLACTGFACHSEDQPVVDAATGKNLLVVAEGKNIDLVFKATMPGTIIVNDFTQGGNLYKGHLNAGDAFTLRANSDHALIGKLPVPLEYATNIADTYRLYFIKD